MGEKNKITIYSKSSASNEKERMITYRKTRIKPGCVLFLLYREKRIFSKVERKSEGNNNDEEKDTVDGMGG